MGLPTAVAACCGALLVAWAQIAQATRLSSHARAPALVLGQAVSPEEGGGPAKAVADSKTIDGPDCGNVKQVISKWSKAKKIGKVAGAARGAVMHADHVGELATKAADKVKEIAESSEAVTAAVNDVNVAVANLTGASTDLSVELDSFNSKRSGAEWPESGVTDEDSVKLKELTKKANEASKKTQDAAANALERAKKSSMAAKAEASAATGKVKAFVESAEAKLKQSKDAAQKAGWVRDDAGEKVERATATAESVRIEDEVKPEFWGNGSQTAVLDALAEDLVRSAEGVTNASDELATLLTDLETAQGELDDVLGPMKKAADAADGGDTSEIVDEEKNLVEADGKLAGFDTIVAELNSQAKVLQSRLGALEALQEQAETILKKPTAQTHTTA